MRARVRARLRCAYALCACAYACVQVSECAWTCAYALVLGVCAVRVCVYDYVFCASWNIWCVCFRNCICWVYFACTDLPALTGTLRYARVVGQLFRTVTECSVRRSSDTVSVPVI